MCSLPHVLRLTDATDNMKTHLHSKGKPGTKYKSRIRGTYLQSILERLRQVIFMAGHHKFEASLCYRARPYIKMAPKTSTRAGR